MAGHTVRGSPELVRCTAMRNQRAAFGCLAALLCVIPAPLGSVETPRTVLDFPQANRVVRLEFGLRAKAPAHCRGRAQVSVGEIHATWGWNFDRPDRFVGADGWNFEVREFNPEGAAYRLREELPNGIGILPNGVYLSIEAPTSARLSVETNRGSFSFSLAELDARGRLEFLGGDAAAVAAPAVRALTRGEASQHDFPAAIATGDGLFVAWTTFHDEANALYLARRIEKEWRTYRVTPAWGDYAGTALASDARGLIHVIWSEYQDDRWRLVDRAFDPRTERWNNEVYVSPDGIRQYFPVAVTASDGSAWTAWQEFRGGSLDIMASRFADGAWSEPIRVSASDANDWAPDLAAGSNGSVWAAWDSYDAGSYGIFVRRLLPGRSDPVLAVPADANRAIEPAIAVDSLDRLWLAWAESGPNWGKDWGVLGRPGTQLRATSRIRLARYANGRWLETVNSLQEAVPAWMSEMHEYPSLAIGPGDAPYVFFRKMQLRRPVAEHALQVKLGDAQHRLQPWYDTVRGMSDILAASFDGKQWRPAFPLPLSTAGAYAQLALARNGDRLLAVWPTDGRTHEDPHARSSQLRYASLRLSAEYAADERLRPLEPTSEPFVNAAPTESTDLARVRAARWNDKAPLRLFRGDLHRHTDLSADSQRDGDILYAYRYALDAGALDFLAVTDHSGAQRRHYYKYQWWRTRQIATMFDLPGRFATFFGYERTVAFPGGHRNVISARRALRPVPISDEEFTGVESWAERLYPALLRQGDIAIAHTTAGGGGTDWRANDPRAEPVVEVFQALRGSYEEENSPGKARTSQSAGFVWNAWKKGWRLGLLANSDHESTHQSYACVWAPELSRRAILDAIKRRRTYAATDNIVLQFEALPTEGAPLKMGSEAKLATVPALQLRLIAPTPVASVEIVRNGEIVYGAEPHTSEVSLTYRDEASAPNPAYYHVRAVQADGQIAWSSPIWIDYREAD